MPGASRLNRSPVSSGQSAILDTLGPFAKLCGSLRYSYNAKSHEEYTKNRKVITTPSTCRTVPRLRYDLSTEAAGRAHENVVRVHLRTVKLINCTCQRHLYPPYGELYPPQANRHLLSNRIPGLGYLTFNSLKGCKCLVVFYNSN